MTSTDLSEAAEASQEGCPQGDTDIIAQADTVTFPFTARQSGVVFCLGIIVHTANAEDTIASL